MTILRTVNSLCKSIQSQPFRKNIQKVFSDLETTGREISMGSIASVINRQFLGYLVANQEAIRQRRTPNILVDIGLLSPEELALLENAHRFLLMLNERLYVLENLLSNACKSISPYSDYNYDCTTSITDSFNLEEISSSLDDLHSHFLNHPSINIIQDCISRLSGTGNIKEDDFVEHVIYYRKKVIEHSLSNLPNGLEVELFNRRDPLRIYMGKLIRSLIVLRDSIHNVNQLLYQAIRYTKPLILSRENVFSYDGLNHNWLGEIFYLSVQPIAKEMYSKPGDIAIVSLKMENSIKDGFYRIEKIDGTDSSDFGLSIRFGLRSIDENMICYPQLLS